jgi:hypothetical protein
MSKVIVGRDAGCDVGTMWTMTRNGYGARCALFSMRDEWELRVLVDGVPLMTRRCIRTQEALDVAEEWKRRMTDTGWSVVRPCHPLRPARGGGV